MKDREKKAEASKKPRGFAGTTVCTTIWLVLAGLFVAALASFSRTWGPALAERIILSKITNLDSECDIKLDIKKLSLGELVVSSLSYSNKDIMASCADARATYRLGALLFQRRIDALTLPQLRASIIGEAQPALCRFLTNSTISASVEIRSLQSVYHGQIRGEGFGGPLDGALSFSPDDNSGSLNVTLRPFPADPLLAFPGDITISTKFSVAARPAAAMRLAVANTPWQMTATGAISNKVMTVDAIVPLTHFSHDDRFIAPILATVMPTANVMPKFGGGISAEFSGVLEPSKSPRWRAGAKIHDAHVSLESGKTAYEISGISARASLEGCGDLWKAHTIPVAITNATAGPLSFGRGFALVSIDEDAIVVTQASFAFCGGHVKVFALRLGLAHLNAGITLILDELDAGQVFKLIPGAEGEATGTLYGRMPLRMTSEREVRLGNAFLFSPPGDTGKISLTNPEALMNALAARGIPPATCKHLGQALQCLEYDVLRLNLAIPDRENGHIAIMLRGKYETKTQTTPVDLNISVNGPIERLVNLSIKTATKKTKKGL